MLELLIVIGAISLLTQRERKSMHGSLAMMYVVMIPIWLGVYVLMVLYVLSGVENLIVIVVVGHALGISAGYGTYWLIVRYRKKAYEKRMGYD